MKSRVARTFCFRRTRARNNWLNLDETAGTDEFTIIFRETPLTKPAFLDEEALRALSEATWLNSIRQWPVSNRTWPESK
jgi:hypothetical protein